jgi:ubiquinone/menaquinone biosynthesis C-methylase UbiE
MTEKQIFDTWPEKYDKWFETPIGGTIKEFESRLVMNRLNPAAGERILDAGCGTGIFTADFLDAGAEVVGLELSYPMVARAARKLSSRPFTPVAGDMTALPFADGCFDKAVSVTAIEFIADAESAVAELFRVTKSGGVVMVATLNSLSPWADRRTEAGRKGHDIFKKIYFRSPREMAALTKVEGRWETAIHFEKTDDPERAREIEINAQPKRPETGAFLLTSWIKP